MEIDSMQFQATMEYSIINDEK